jgi:hypothetical protein
MFAPAVNNTRESMGIAVGERALEKGPQSLAVVGEGPKEFGSLAQKSAEHQCWSDNNGDLGGKRHRNIERKGELG